MFLLYEDMKLSIVNIKVKFSNSRKNIEQKCQKEMKESVIMLLCEYMVFVLIFLIH